MELTRRQSFASVWWTDEKLMCSWAEVEAIHITHPLTWRKGEGAIRQERRESAEVEPWNHPWQHNANTCPQTARHFYSLDSILVLQFHSCSFLVTGLKDYLWWLNVWHLSKECLFSPDWTCFRQKLIWGRINNQCKQSKVCSNYSCNMEVKIQTWKCLL